VGRGGYVTCSGLKERCTRFLEGKPGRMRPLGRCVCKWKDNITMELKEIGWESVDWIHV
jgi:hypothetical protein